MPTKSGEVGDDGVVEESIVGGRYRVQSTLGVGGMGRVVLATDVNSGEKLALKILHAELQWNPEATARFLREARTTGKLNSPHALHTLGFGETEEGIPYIAMEYLEGEDLQQRLERGPVQPSQVVDWTLQALDAIAEAHTLDIVHRDLKPENLFLSRLPNADDDAEGVCVKVLDFGIAKAMSEASQHGLTASDQMLGTPGYMAPEQMRAAKHVGPTADVWSLGSLLYVTLSGQEPFPGKNVTAVIAAVIASDPTPLSEHVPDLPSGLCDVVMRCLNKAPEQRYDDVGQLALALAPFGGPSAQEAAERVRTRVAADTAEFATPEGRSSTWLTLAIAIVLVGGGLTWYWTAGRSGTPAPTATATATVTQPLAPAPPALDVPTPPEAPRAAKAAASAAASPERTTPLGKSTSEDAPSPSGPIPSASTRPDLGF